MTMAPMNSAPMNVIKVDARGLRCPLPVIRLAEAARDAPTGTAIVVLASDPAARYDIPAWCRMRHHELREMTEAGETAEVALPTGTDDPEMTEGSDSPEAHATPGQRADPTYLRFLVVVGRQRSKAEGTGSGSERSSRTR